MGHSVKCSASIRKIKWKWLQRNNVRMNEWPKIGIHLLSVWKLRITRGAWHWPDVLQSLHKAFQEDCSCTMLISAQSNKMGCEIYNLPRKECPRHQQGNSAMTVNQNPSTDSPVNAVSS